MKKLYLFLLAPAIAIAQIPNAGFEESYSSGKIRNWGYYYNLPVTLDVETGQTTFDEILYASGDSFSSSSIDVHTGSTALEITNALNLSTGEILSGTAELFDDSQSEVATGWNGGRALPAASAVDFFAFHYKFDAFQGETAMAVLEATGATGEIVRSATILLYDTAGEYAFAYAPATLALEQAPTFISIRFFMSSPGQAPSFESRLLIDDVAVNESGLRTRGSALVTQYLYPTVTEGELFFAQPVLETKGIATDSSGRQVEVDIAGDRMDVSGLASGIYTFQIGGEKPLRFIKK